MMDIKGDKTNLARTAAIAKRFENADNPVNQRRIFTRKLCMLLSVTLEQSRI